MINTRWGAALTPLANTIPDLPLRFIHAFMADDLRVDWQLPMLENLLLSRGPTS